MYTAYSSIRNCLKAPLANGPRLSSGLDIHGIARWLGRWCTAAPQALETLKSLGRVAVDRLVPMWLGSMARLAQAAEPDQVPYSSVVIEYTVPQEKSWAFRKWHRSLVNAAQDSPGFIRADRHRPLPCQGGLLKWYAVVHFEQPEDLNRWLLSPQREALLKLGRHLFKSYKFKSFETGLEGWFSHHSGNELTGLGPPAWKQILSVVLGLYPVIMIQDVVIDALDLMKDWDPASAMLVKNLITTCILTLVVMPMVMRVLDFWLQPAHRRASMRIEIVGATFTIAAMVAMVFVFSEIH